MSGYSDIVMDHFSSPRNAGAMDCPHAVGRAVSSAGPKVTMYLRMEGDQIAEARFVTAGCGATIAACSLLTEMVRGQTYQQCLNITWEQLDDALGSLPTTKKFSAGLAIDALRDAIRNVFRTA